MKKNFYYFLSAAMLLATACKKDQTASVSQTDATKQGAAVVLVNGKLDTAKHAAVIISKTISDTSNFAKHFVKKQLLFGLGVDIPQASDFTLDWEGSAPPENGGVYDQWYHILYLTNQKKSSWSTRYTLYKDGAVYQVLATQDGNGVEAHLNLNPGVYYMYAEFLDGQWAGTYQKSNTFTIYPTQTAPYGYLPMLRYFNTSTGKHFETTNWNEMRSGSGGFHLEGIIGDVLASAGTGNNPIYRYFNSSTGDHHYSVNPATPGGYTYEGLIGYVQPQSGGTLTQPLNRYFKSGTGGEHVLCTTPEVPSGYTFETTMGYMLPK